MDLINQIGISYKANYLIQGNQLERCKTSTKLQANNTELKMRSDGKDFDISNILKEYNGNIIFNIPAINPDLSNLKSIDSKVKRLINNNIKMITINASNLDMDLFEWSTNEEQKKYFFNIVKSIATLASNKIVVAIENTEIIDSNRCFGSTISELSDILIYSKKILMNEFKFSEEDANKYIGVCLNVDNILKTQTIMEVQKWFEVFNKNIECIKISNNLNSFDEVTGKIINECIATEYKGILLFETEEELEEIEEKYKLFKSILIKSLGDNNIEVTESKIKPVSDGGYTNIIVLSIILITIFISILMVLVKFKNA